MKPSSGIWRFADRLPETGGRATVTIGEGNTPLVHLESIGRKIGVPLLYGKLEGHNPTGSYKDRIAAVSMTLALAEGKRGWIATSSGNAGASLGAYGARASLPGLLLVVPTAPREKLVPMRSFVETVAAVEGVGTGGNPEDARAMFDAVAGAAEEHDLFLGVTAHAYNPLGMRGADTISYELLEHGDEPDVCYVPTGGGGLVSAVGRGFWESGAGTRVIAVQPSGCAPIARTLDGEIPGPTVEGCTTVVSGLQLPLPPDGDLAVRTVRETAGWGTHIADDRIFEAQLQLAESEGVFVEPACATALAAAALDREEGRLSGKERVVLVLTATGLKDLSSAERGLAPLKTLPAQALREEIGEWIAYQRTVLSDEPRG